MNLRTPSPTSRRSTITWVGAALALLVLGWLNRRDLHVARDAFGSLRPVYVVGGLVLVVAGLANQAAFHAAAQRAAGEEVAASELIVPVAASGFLNLVVKSGAMAGLAPMVSSARRRGRPTGPTVAGYLVVNVLGHLAFALALAVGVAILAFDQQFTWTQGVAALVFVVLSAAQIGLLVAATRSRDVLRRLFMAAARWRDRFHRIVRPDRRTANVDDTFSQAGSRADELHDAVGLLRSNPRRAGRAFVHACAVELIGITQLWCVLKSLNLSVNPGLPVTAYAVSVLFTIVGVFPGGLGFVEASLGALLVSSRVARGDAVAAVVLYRVLELWLPALIGLLATRRLADGRST